MNKIVYYMTQNFYEHWSFFRWFLESKEERKRHAYFKAMHSSVVQDLKEIYRNDECNSAVSLGNRYYHIIIKGQNIQAWRAYFLKGNNAFVAFPVPCGSIYVQKLLGGNHFHDCGMESSERSMFWLPSWSFNYDSLWNVQGEIDDKKFVLDWLIKHTDYKEYEKNFPGWDAESYCKINLD